MATYDKASAIIAQSFPAMAAANEIVGKIKPASDGEKPDGGKPQPSIQEHPEFKGLQKKLEEIEEKEGRKLGGRARKRLKEDLVHELLLMSTTEDDLRCYTRG